MIKIYEDGLPPELCRALIARFEADARVEADPQPDYSTRKYLNVSQCADWLTITGRVMQRANDLVADYFTRPPELAAATHNEWSDDGYVLARYDVGDACIMHVDGQCSVYPNNGLRLATLLFYLNDVPVGGETTFPLQDVKIQPKEGRAVMFPVGYTHPHVVPTAASTRYILQTWITDPYLAVAERELLDELYEEASEGEEPG